MFVTDNKDLDPSQSRFDQAWKVVQKHQQWEAKWDYEHLEWDFSVKHVRLCADQGFNLKLTRHQAEHIVNEAQAGSTLRSPFNWNEAEEAIRLFCRWADLGEDI